MAAGGHDLDVFADEITHIARLTVIHTVDNLLGYLLVGQAKT